MNWPISSERLRGMYASGRADDTARRLARIWAVVFGLGLPTRRWVALEVPGRRSGRTTRFPLGMARLDRRWYLVSMLGEQSNWVQNVRAARGRVTLRHGRAVRRILQEVPVGERPPVLKRYLQQVPGARPHFPVSRNADVADFATIAARYPVFLVTQPRNAGVRNGSRRSGPRPRQRWWRWILVGTVAIVVIIAGVVAAFVQFGPSFAPLALPPGHLSAPSGPLGATWQVANGSLAAFRVQERALGVSNYVGGQTAAVTGVLVIAGSTVTSAQFRINLTAVKVNGKVQPQFISSLGVHAHPLATFTLAKPVRLSPVFADGSTVAATATGELAMNGVTRPVTVMLTARRDGPGLQTAGFIPVQFARWGIRQPAGFGFVGSLADNGEAEFLLVLHRQ